MKRIWIGVVAALILLYPLAAWLMGFAIEKRFDGAIAEMHEKAPYAAVTEHHFRRGWYTSQDDTTLEISRSALGAVPGDATAAPSPFQITIHSVVHHGPICGWNCLGLARAESHIVVGGPLQPVVAGFFGTVEPLLIRSRLGFFGGGSAVLSSPAFEDKALPDGARAGWGGFEADVDYGARMDSYAMHMTAPRALYSSADGKRIEMTGAALDSRSKRVLRTLYAGDSAVKIGRLAFAGAGAGGAATVTVDDVRSAASSRVESGYMSMTVKTGTGTIATGPLTLTGVNFDFTFRHLEIESLEKLTAGIQQANGNAALAPAARTAQMLAVLKQQGASLLAQQPELALDRISFANAKGEAVLKGVVRMPGVTAADFAEGADAKAFMAKLDLDLDLTVDEALLQSLPGGTNGEKQLLSLSDQGLLTHDNGRFHTAILFRHGQMTFNGKPFQPGIAPASPPVSPPPPPPPVAPRP